MKTKLFKLEDLNNLQQFENEINAFTTSHNTIDVKITTCSTKYAFYLIYVVLYN